MESKEEEIMKQIVRVLKENKCNNKESIQILQRLVDHYRFVEFVRALGRHTTLAILEG